MDWVGGVRSQAKGDWAIMRGVTWSDGSDVGGHVPVT